MAISDAGWVAGNGMLDGQYRAFVYHDGIVEEVGSLADVTRPTDINEQGQVVGSVSVGMGYAFLYEGGVLTDLNSVIDPASGWILGEANGINDYGWIAGTGWHNGELRAFLLTPSAVLLGDVNLDGAVNARQTSVYLLSALRAADTRRRPTATRMGWSTPWTFPRSSTRSLVAARRRCQNR